MNNIIGSGLIAKSFLNKNIPSNVIIFSSGVSNSQCINLYDFNREKNLLESVIDKYKNKKIIYFSTSSVDYQTKDKYILHKVDMENILRIHDNYQIYRIPQIVGITRNNTLVSFFTKSLIRNETVFIKSKVKRNIIDIDDLSRIVIEDVNNKIIKEERISYIKSKYSIEVFLIYKKIAEILNLPLNYKLIDCGEDLNIDDNIKSSLIKNDDPINHITYWEKVLEKYVNVLVKINT